MTAEGPREDRGAGEIDAARIMEQIRARVSERRAAGAYSDEELEEIARMELRLQEREEYGVEMDRLISWLHAHWEATGPVEVGPGAVLNPAKETLKSTLRLLLSPLSRLLLSKQNQINAKIVQLFSGALPPLRESSRDVEKRMENLALRLEKENSNLRERVKDVTARLERLEGPREGEGPRQGDR